MTNQPLSQTTPFALPTEPLSQYITAGSLPNWEQFPPACQQELVLTLAGLLLSLPELRALEVGHADQP